MTIRTVHHCPGTSASVALRADQFGLGLSIAHCCPTVIVKTPDSRLIEKDRLAGGPILRGEYQLPTLSVVFDAACLPLDSQNCRPVPIAGYRPQNGH